MIAHLHRETQRLALRQTPRQPRQPRQRPACGLWRRLLLALLIVLIAGLGAALAQRQTLGPLHTHQASHADAAQTDAAAGLLKAAWGWWWQQVQAQTEGRRHLRAHQGATAHVHAHHHASAHEHEHTSGNEPEHVDAHAHEHAQPPVSAIAHAGDHSHSAWQRHHHEARNGGASGLVSLEAPLEELGSAAAALLTIVLGTPATSLRIPVDLGMHRNWPRLRAASFSSRTVAPPLRPPRH